MTPPKVTEMRPEDTPQALKSLGIAARKSLGQNFVIDSSVISNMVAHAGVDDTMGVVEIGPGLGALTRELAQSARQVIAIEKDSTLAPLLRSQLLDESVTNVEIVEADATEVHWPELLQRDQLPEVSSWVAAGNLPYNVAVPIVMSLLDNAPQIESITAMVQLEVAERLAASPTGRSIGLPTLQINWHGSCEICFIVPPEVFVPAPHIDSAVIKINRTPDAPATAGVGVSQGHVMNVAAQAYRQRRKMLRKSIGSLINEAAFVAADIPATARPEELSIWDWIHLVQAHQDGHH